MTDNIEAYMKKVNERKKVKQFIDFIINEKNKGVEKEELEKFKNMGKVLLGVQKE